MATKVKDDTVEKQISQSANLFGWEKKEKKKRKEKFEFFVGVIWGLGAQTDALGRGGHFLAFS